ncbi:MAG: pilin [Candidatus Kerfeldbacteria bacterium]
MNTIKKTTLLLATLGMTMVFFVLAALPADAAYEDCSISPAITLEIPIGIEVKTTSLTHYVTLIYEFAVSSIGVIAAVMIMYNGVKWVAAAGNAQTISNAKEGIISAITGLAIALMSYSLLFLLGPQLVNFGEICPTGINFIPAEAQLDYGVSEWTACPGGTAPECNDVVYCQISGAACECQNIGQNEVNYVCRPTGVDVMAEGNPCVNDDNCKGESFCKNESATSPGVCTDQELNSLCQTDADCEGEFYTCEYEISFGYNICRSHEGRENGETCANHSECASGVCHTIDETCDPGDDTSALGCSQQDENCKAGWRCGNDSRCRPAVDGDDCNKFNSECSAGPPYTLFCVDHADDQILGSGSCREGENEDPCDDVDTCRNDLGFVCCDHTTAATNAPNCTTQWECFHP